MTSIIDTDRQNPSSDVAGFPEWIKQGLSVKTGRDPLGLQTITVDRIMPQLLPGILALSQRARYLSFYPFLLAEFQAHKLSPTNNALSTFINAREYEYGLAVQLCPRGCGARWSAVIGKERVGHDVIDIAFGWADCKSCPVRSTCTQKKKGSRTMKLLPKAHHLPLQAARQRQQTIAFREQYARASWH